MKFFKYGIDVFDGRLKKYGGHGHFIAGKIFKWRMGYLHIYLKVTPGFEIIYKNDDHYYDGYHNHIYIGWVLISWGSS